MKLTSLTTGLLVAAYLSLITLQVQARRSKCSPERDREMDKCASRMGFLGDHSFVVPKNLTAMEPFCANLKSSLTCTQTYSRECLQGFTRQLLTSLLRRGRQQYGAICSSDDSRRQFMTKMSCLTDDKIEDFHKCMDASIVRFEYISNKVRNEHKLPNLCCSYQIFNRDLDATIERICSKSSAGGAGEFVQRIVGGTAGEFFSLICENHRSLEDCKRSPATSATLGKLEEHSAKVAAGKLSPKSKSLIPVLLEILDSSS